MTESAAGPEPVLVDQGAVNLAPAVPVGHESLRGGRTGWSARDPLRRRMLALADVCTVAAVAATLALLGPGPKAALAVFLYLPAWILAAKLNGLYDRDQRSLRHLTVDECRVLSSGRSRASPGSRSSSRSRRLAISRCRDRHPGARLAASVARVLLRGLARLVWRQHHAAGADRDRRWRTARALASGESSSSSPTSTPPWSVQPPRRARARRPPRRTRCAAGRRRPHHRRVGVDRRAADRRARRALPSRADQAERRPAGARDVRDGGQLRHVADLPVVEYNTWDISRSTLLAQADRSTSSSRRRCSS